MEPEPKPASYEACLKRQQNVKQLFAHASNREEQYEQIISLGKKAPPLPDSHRIASNVVPGCQSIMYLYSWQENSLLYFAAYSEALISAGLAQLLIAVYSGLPPETILTCPPLYLEELQIADSLTPNRANGLYSIHLRIKQEAMRALISTRPSP